MIYVPWWLGTINSNKSICM